MALVGGELPLRGPGAVEIGASEHQQPTLLAGRRDGAPLGSQPIKTLERRDGTHIGQILGYPGLGPGPSHPDSWRHGHRVGNHPGLARQAAVAEGIKLGATHQHPAPQGAQRFRAGLLMTTEVVQPGQQGQARGFQRSPGVFRQAPRPKHEGRGLALLSPTEGVRQIGDHLNGVRGDALDPLGRREQQQGFQFGALQQLRYGNKCVFSAANPWISQARQRKGPQGSDSTVVEEQGQPHRPILAGMT